MDKTKKEEIKKEAPKLKPKLDFNPQTFSGGRSFKPQATKAGFNPGSFKTQHKG